MKTFFLLLIFFLSACSASRQQTNQNDQSVVAGQDAFAVGRYEKSIVSIWYPEKNSNCTGTLIDEGLVLTAAHCDSLQQPYICFSHESPRELAHRKELAKYCVRAKGSLAHRFYLDDMTADTQNVNDLRLIQFDGELPADIQPMALPLKEMRLAPGQNVILSGHGLLNFSPPIIPRSLQIADLQFSSRFSETELQFDPFEKRGACIGDSGGPVFIRRNGKPVLIGVVSRGAKPYGEDTCHDGFVATEVAHYLNWIADTAKILKGHL